MKIKLRRSWFYKIDAKPHNDRRAISGGRYRKGVHDDVPDELRDQLPKDAVILSDTEADITRGSHNVLDDLGILDVEHAAVAAENAIVKIAEENRKANIQAKRVAALAKAREAKKAKKKDAK